MAWVERLVAEGRIEMDSTHPLFEAFDALTKYISQQIDTLPLAVSRRPVGWACERALARMASSAPPVVGILIFLGEQSERQ